MPSAKHDYHEPKITGVSCAFGIARCAQSAQWDWMLDVMWDRVSELNFSGTLILLPMDASITQKSKPFFGILHIVR